MSLGDSVILSRNLDHRSGRRIGYARVSTDKQSTDQQVAELRRAGCKKIFIDEGIKATAKSRPGLNEAKDALKSGDVFVVWAIDRAFRSTLEAIVFLESINAEGVEFLSLTQNIDTRTPEGRKWFIDTASWAEYEREVISRRTRLQMADAKAKGVKFGRKPSLTPRAAYRAFIQVREEGKTIASVAKRFGCSPITLRRTFRRLELDRLRAPPQPHERRLPP